MTVVRAESEAPDDVLTKSSNAQYSTLAEVEQSFRASQAVAALCQTDASMEKELQIDGKSASHAHARATTPAVPEVMDTAMMTDDEDITDLVTSVNQGGGANEDETSDEHSHNSEQATPPRTTHASLTPMEIPNGVRHSPGLREIVWVSTRPIFPGPAPGPASPTSPSTVLDESQLAGNKRRRMSSDAESSRSQTPLRVAQKQKRLPRGDQRKRRRLLSPPSAAIKASRKSAPVGLPGTGSGRMPRGDQDGVPSRVGMPWRLQSRRKPCAHHITVVLANIADEDAAFTTIYRKSFYPPSYLFYKDLDLPQFRLPFLQRNLRRELFVSHGCAMASDGPRRLKDFAIENHLVTRSWEEKKKTHARQKRLFETSISRLNVVHGKLNDTVPSGTWVRFSLWFKSPRSHVMSWRVLRQLHGRKLNQPIHEICSVPDEDDLTCELRVDWGAEAPGDEQPHVVGQLICASGDFRDVQSYVPLGYSSGRHYGQIHVESPFRWVMDCSLVPYGRFLLKGLSSWPSIKYRCPFCRIGGCRTFDALDTHVMISHAGEGEVRLKKDFGKWYSVVDGADKQAGVATGKITAGILTAGPVASNCGQSEFTQQDILPLDNATVCHEQESEASVPGDVLVSNPVNNPERQRRQSRPETTLETVPAPTTDQGRRLDLPALLNHEEVCGDEVFVKQEPADEQPWRVRDPKAYVEHSSWTVPGTTMDLMRKLDEMYEGDRRFSYMLQETQTHIWAQHNWTDRMRLMSAVWNQWRYIKGPMDKMNMHGYMHDFVHKYAPFFKLAKLRVEFDRFVMGFLFERRLIDLGLAVGSIALYDKLVQ